MPIGSYDPKNISQLLTANEKIYVPVFQRPFSWGKDQYDQYFEDLLLTMDNHKEPYFIGSIFFKEEESRYIIDGQQRLSVSTILISLIRDMLYEHGDDRVPQIESDFITKRDLKTRDAYYKINLGEINLDFFRKYIQDKDKPQNKISKFKKEKDVNFSNKLIFDCYTNYYKKINEKTKLLDHKKCIAFLIDLLDTLTEKFYALTITINEETEAFTIFETLNDRGLDLTISDLLKNYLFSIIHGKVDATELRTYLKIWDTTIENLGNYTTSFFKHYWNSKNKPISEKKIYKSLKKNIKTKDEVLTFLKELGSEGEVYSGFINPEVTYWEDKEIVSLLEEISILGVMQCFPLLLSARAIFDDKNFKNVLSSCISLSFRYSTVCNLHNNVLEGSYSEIANKVRNGELPDAKSVSKALAPLWPKTDVYKTLFLDMDFKSTATPKYILKKINDALDEGREIISVDNISLEHIVPKKMIEKNIVKLNKIGIDHTSEIYKFRNMTILGEEYNRKASSEMFEKKIEMYKKSKLPINEKLKEFKNWSPKEIEIWNNFLFDCSEKTWVL